jgi:hypothetical protein
MLSVSFCFIRAIAASVAGSWVISPAPPACLVFTGPASVQCWASNAGWATTISGNWPSSVAAIRPWSCWRRLRSRVLYAVSRTNACLNVYSASGAVPRRKNQFCAHQLRQGIIKVPLRHLGDGTDKLV